MAVADADDGVDVAEAVVAQDYPRRPDDDAFRPRRLPQETERPDDGGGGTEAVGGCDVSDSRRTARTGRLVWRKSRRAEGRDRWGHCRRWDRVTGRAGTAASQNLRLVRGFVSSIWYVGSGTRFSPRNC